MEDYNTKYEKTMINLFRILFENLLQTKTKKQHSIYKFLKPFLYKSYA